MFQQEKEPDPHGFMRTGMHAQRAYFIRQLRRMMPVTVVLVFVAMFYSIQTQSFVPLLTPRILNMGLWLFMWWTSWTTQVRLFAGAARLQATGNEEKVKELWQPIGFMMWSLYGLQVVGAYWVGMILYLNYFMEG